MSTGPWSSTPAGPDPGAPRRRLRGGSLRPRRMSGVSCADATVVKDAGVKDDLELAMISLRGLECLVAIVDHRSLTKAATVLNLSQPAISHQIATIERELGTPVIERLPRGIRPTAAGLAAAAEARVALAAAEKAVLAARRAAAGTGGRIRIACAEPMTAWLLVPVLRQW